MKLAKGLTGTTTTRLFIISYFFGMYQARDKSFTSPGLGRVRKRLFRTFRGEIIERKKFRLNGPNGPGPNAGPTNVLGLPCPQLKHKTGQHPVKPQNTILISSIIGITAVITDLPRILSLINACRKCLSRVRRDDCEKNITFAFQPLTNKSDIARLALGARCWGSGGS